MSMHPYVAQELARARQEDLRRQMISSRRQSHWSRKPAVRPIRNWRLRGGSPRPAPAR